MSIPRTLICTLALLLGLVAYPSACWAMPEPDGQPCAPSVGDLVTLDDIPDASPRGLSVQSVPATDKSLPLLAIVVGLGNVSYDANYNWSSTLFEGTRSLAAYYADMSFGQFTFTPVQESSAYGRAGNANKADTANDGVVHVALSQNHGDWTSVHTGSTEAAASLASVLAEAVQQADQFVDFSRYDADGNGRITTNELAITFVVAGYEGSAILNQSLVSKNKLLWAHRWTIQSLISAGNASRVAVPKPDGVTVSDYTAVSERLNWIQQESVGIFAHELGHYLGLPDLYDTLKSTSNAWSDYAVGHMSVMAKGSWGITKDFSRIPTAMDPFCRMKLGWITPEEAQPGSTFEVVAQDFSGGSSSNDYQVVRIPTASPREYYLVENRQFNSWDEALGTEYSGAVSKGGLALWHIDEGTYDAYVSGNRVNASNHHPAVMPLYPETDSANQATFIGTGVGTTQPFYDSSSWASSYAASCGPSLVLPLYSTGMPDTPAERTASNLSITFLNPTSASMRIALSCSHELVHHEPIEPTCTEPGELEHWECARCGGLFADADASAPIGAADLPVPAPGHDLRPVAASSPTCTEPGELEHWECARCGGLFAEDDGGGVEPITVAELLIPATGEHAWDGGVVVSAATSEVEGVLLRTCAVCGQTRKESVPKVVVPLADEVDAGDNEPEQVTESVAEAEHPVQAPFSTFRLRSLKQTKRSITIKWAHVKGAKTYIVHGALCGKSHELVEQAVVAGHSYTVRSLNGKRLLSARDYRFMVSAIGSDGKVIANSKVMRASTKGGKAVCANRVKAQAGKKLSLKKGASFKLKARCVSSGKRHVSKRYCKLSYESTNESIATVSRSGKIRARSAGTCSLYAYTPNGAFTRIRIHITVPASRTPGSNQKGQSLLVAPYHPGSNKAST